MARLRDESIPQSREADRLEAADGRRQVVLKGLSILLALEKIAIWIQRAGQLILGGDLQSDVVAFTFPARTSAAGTRWLTLITFDLSRSAGFSVSTFVNSLCHTPSAHLPAGLAASAHFRVKSLLPSRRIALVPSLFLRHRSHSGLLWAALNT